MPDNKTITGVVEYVDLSGGFWRLITENGEKFVLNLIHDNGTKQFVDSTQKVTVCGVVENDFGIGMTSDQTLRVQSWSAAATETQSA